MKDKPVILVVDDNANNRLLYTDLLEGAGCRIVEAVDAASGMALARKEKPDVIIMDVQLPDMQGYEAAKILRQDKETCDIPIVFVTASVKVKDREEIAGIANSSAISKPINTRIFVSEINQFIK